MSAAGDDAILDNFHCRKRPQLGAVFLVEGFFEFDL